MSRPILTAQEQQAIHRATLDVLRDPGMRILSPGMRRALSRAGARVDENREVVSFPSELVTGMLEGMRSQIEGGARQLVFNGVVASRTPPGVKAKFGGACIRFLDSLRGEVRDPTEDDLVMLLQLGEALPNVAQVGNPVACLRTSTGEPVPPHMQRVRTAALVAKHSTKCGPTEVANVAELEFLVALGELVRGGAEAYLRDPCFVTAKETISPLTLDRQAAEVLVALAKRGLPCTIIPMPLSGVSSPVTATGNVVVANAEILGAMVGVRAVAPDAIVAGGVISGVMDMRTALVSFAAPEAIRQDLMLADLHRELYGFDLGLGTGYTDASAPGGRAAIEKLAKYAAAAAFGCHNYPVGLLDGGRTFCPEQALIDLDIAEMVDREFSCSGAEDAGQMVAVIREAGIGGSYLGLNHTVQHYREASWQPAVLVSDASAQAETDMSRMVAAARDRFEALLGAARSGAEPRANWEGIDAIVAEAERALRPDA
ncbi:MAG: trimethylamine methyltransferase family protein [Armatimonadota bacterium]